ncbi:MAG TPA: hypothetical protein VFU13_03270 [Steroidobacteraceae bacterium]|nr:hypothetical protein [Steroidobacteraceae bacterium]
MSALTAIQFRPRAVALGVALAMNCIAAAADSPVARDHRLDFTGGMFHGPGHMADTPLPTGRLAPLVIERGLKGRIEYFNNGPQAPNLPSEAVFEASADGRLSDGRAFNEHMDGGIAEVGRGAMRLLTVVARTDRNHGIGRFALDRELNWHLHVDLALDPGFPEGLLVIENLDITTGGVAVPKSRQSETGQEGGVDRAGSLQSGAQLVGRLGDYDADGFLDGVLVGVTSIPIGHMFTPGAPAVQVRNFSTDIPIDAWDAARLTVSSLGNFKSHFPSQDARAIDEMTARIDAAVTLLKKQAKTPSVEQEALAKLRDELRRCTAPPARSGGRSDCANFPQTYFTEVQALRERMARHGSLLSQEQ